MRIENYIDLCGASGFSGLIFAEGSFGVIDGSTEYQRREQDGCVTYTATRNGILVTSVFEPANDGALLRRDSIKNVTDGELEINSLVSRFCLDGDDYDVYTQYSAWQHESEGDWQRLTTEIRSECQGMRGCDGAAPLLAMHNRHTGKNTVFHLFPCAKWQMSVKKAYSSDREKVVVEAGFCNTGLHFRLFAGEEIDLPRILFFAAENKTDLDAYKLHRYFNSHYPRRVLPVVYNSWLSCFDKLDPDGLMREAAAAAELGIEAFMIDAGWFGDGNGWWQSVGDWEENTVSGPCGRLAEISAQVRKLGMTFGLWFEPERANPKCRAAKEHPDYYIGGRFLDFANPDAADYMLDVISEQIEKYSIGWVKFDCNDSLVFDPSGCGFYRYLKGQRRFTEKLRSRFPDLYITNCAGGGYRMELYQAEQADSFWPTDNQSPIDGLEIVKNTLKRMPPALIDRWNVQKYAEGFPRYGQAEPAGIMFNCNDATWTNAVSVDPSFAEGFLAGGPIGFSCPISSFPDEYKERWRKAIAQFKLDRDFYATASAHVIADSDGITAIEYADENYRECIVFLFIKKSRASELTLYPVLDKSATYILHSAAPNGSDPAFPRVETKLCGKELTDDGIRFDKLKNYTCRTARLKKI